MGIASVTTHPMKYMYMETIKELLDERYPQGLPQEDKGALHMTFDLANAPAQRRTAQILAEALQGKAVYLRDRDWKSVYNRGYYEVAGWTVAGSQVATDFSLDTLPRVLSVLEWLRSKGYAPDGEVLISLGEEIGLRQALNLCTMIEAKRELLEMALQLENEIRVMADSTLALSIPLGAFDLEKIEAMACLLHQMALQAEQVGRVRMRPVDVTNARYQMRTWLLRLGFIGEAFARPRRTLLEHLEGDAAFRGGREARRSVG